MPTARSKERVEITGATAIKDEVKDAVDSSADESDPNDLKGLLQTGSMRPDLDSGVLDFGYHWGSERPKNYEYLIYKLQKKRGSPPPSAELYESYKFAAATMNGNKSSIVNAANVFKDRDNVNENEIRNYGQILQQEFKSPTPRLVGGFRDGKEYLEQSYERFGGAADTIKDERTRLSAHSAGERTPSGTSFGCEAARMRYIGAFLVAERQLAFHCLKRFSPNAAYYRFDEKDHGHVITFIISESRITLFANFGRTGSNVEYNVGKYLEYHMSELLCLSQATSYETFKEAWTVLRNAEEYSKQEPFAIDLEMQKSMQVASWKAFNAEKKYEANEDFQSALARRRTMAIEAWRSEEEMIQSRRNLNGMGPEDREAHFKLQQVRYD